MAPPASEALAAVGRRLAEAGTVSDKTAPTLASSVSALMMVGLFMRDPFCIRTPSLYWEEARNYQR